MLDVEKKLRWYVARCSTVALCVVVVYSGHSEVDQLDYSGGLVNDHV